jgi:hypothetical protein
MIEFAHEPQHRSSFGMIAGEKASAVVRLGSAIGSGTPKGRPSPGPHRSPRGVQRHVVGHGDWAEHVLSTVIARGTEAVPRWLEPTDGSPNLQQVSLNQRATSLLILLGQLLAAIRDRIIGRTNGATATTAAIRPT